MYDWKLKLHQTVCNKRHFQQPFKIVNGFLHWGVVLNYVILTVKSINLNSWVSGYIQESCLVWRSVRRSRWLWTCLRWCGSYSYRSRCLAQTWRRTTRCTRRVCAASGTSTSLKSLRSTSTRYTVFLMRSSRISLLILLHKNLFCSSNNDYFLSVCWKNFNSNFTCLNWKLY